MLSLPEIFLELVPENVARSDGSPSRLAQKQYNYMKVVLNTRVPVFWEGLFKMLMGECKKGRRIKGYTKDDTDDD